MESYDIIGDDGSGNLTSSRNGGGNHRTNIYFSTGLGINSNSNADRLQDLDVGESWQIIFTSDVIFKSATANSVDPLDEFDLNLLDGSNGGIGQTFNLLDGPTEIGVYVTANTVIEFKAGVNSVVRLDQITFTAPSSPNALFSGQRVPRFAYGFSSNMVIQREENANVWGFAHPGTQVQVSVVDQADDAVIQTATATSGDNGKWMLQLNPMAAGGPYSLHLESGGIHFEQLDDVLFGDVWICSGQSNMRYKLSRMDADDAYIFQDELDALLVQSSFPIRHAMYNRGGDKFEWLEVTRETAINETINPQGVTAVGYFFAKHLREHFQADVPIGIVQTGAGGKAIRHFIPKDVQWENQNLKDIWLTQVRSWTTETYWEELEDEHGVQGLADHEAAIDTWLSGAVLEPCPVYLEDYPGYLFYDALPPLMNMTFKGMVWYQGEVDASRYDVYPDHLEILIDFYRSYFEYPDMPYIVVMLPPFANGYYPDFVAGQLALAESMDNVAASYAPEGGDADDIHPAKKQIVGQRAALSALAEAYGMDIDYLGPRFDSVQRTGNTLIVRFKDTAGGLKLADGKHTLTGFRISGDPGSSFIAADADLGGDMDSVEVTIPVELQSEQTIYLDFNREPFYEPVLYGGNDLPAVFFETTISELLSADINDINKSIDDLGNDTINLFAIFSDSDHLDSELTYSIIDSPLPQIIDWTDINAATGSLTISYPYDAKGTGTLTLQAKDPDGNIAQSTVSITLAGLPAPTIVANDDSGIPGSGAIVSPSQDLNEATNLLEQSVTVTNQSSTTAIDGFTVTISNLPEGAEVYNASDLSTPGEASIHFNHTLLVGQTYSFNVEYFYQDQSGAFTPDLSVVMGYDLASGAIAGGSTPVPSLTFENGNRLLDFPSIVGNEYFIEYRDDLTEGSWTRVSWRLKAEVDRLQWIDSGPPKTSSSPESETKRFYRVIDTSDAN